MGGLGEKVGSACEEFGDNESGISFVFLSCSAKPEHELSIGTVSGRTVIC